MVENGNQKQIYIWVRKYFLLPSCRGDYTHWELHQSVEERILLKSRYSAIHENFSVSKTSLQRYLNAILPPLKCSSLKHPLYLRSLGKISNKSIKKTITENIVKLNLGHKSYLLNGVEAYIVVTT